MGCRESAETSAPNDRGTDEVLVLLSSMPSGVLGPVFATRFRCDGETASAIAFVNILLSVIAVPLVFSVLIR